MNDTIKANRDLLGKKKTAIERQKDEIRIRPSTYEKVNLDYVAARVSAKLKRNRGQELVAAFGGIAIILCAIGTVVWIFRTLNNSSSKGSDEEASRAFFHSITYRQPDGIVLRTDYYVGGPKAAETRMKEGKRHQNSESYYPSGEQFRSALYYYDTLVREVYFYKNGDTIKNFPIVPDTIVMHLTLHHIKIEKKIEFDLIDGKIIGGTYKESHLRNGK